MELRGVTHEAYAAIHILSAADCGSGNCRDGERRRSDRRNQGHGPRFKGTTRGGGHRDDAIFRWQASLRYAYRRQRAFRVLTLRDGAIRSARLFQGHVLGLDQACLHPLQENDRDHYSHASPGGRVRHRNEIIPAVLGGYYYPGTEKTYLSNHRLVPVQSRRMCMRVGSCVAGTTVPNGAVAR